jgi:hypothetical protein
VTRWQFDGLVKLNEIIEKKRESKKLKDMEMRQR